LRIHHRAACGPPFVFRRDASRRIPRAAAGLFVAVFGVLAPAQLSSAPEPKPPIIDVHLHAFPADLMGRVGMPNPVTGKPSEATTDDDLLRAALAAMSRYNIVKAITSGPLVSVRRWVAAAPDRLVGSAMFPHPPPLPDLGLLRDDLRSRQLGALGEVTAQYAGISPSDASLEPYMALAEEMDVPVGIHTGFGPPGAVYECCPKFRESLGDPLLLEELLVRHPKMRVYVMHAGYPYLGEMVALLHAYPQVYADVAVIDWLLPRSEFHEYLRRLVQAGFGKRLMFGSDQMVWPEAIGMAVEGIESARFLTPAQKRDIFYNNAARFLRMDQPPPLR